MHLRALLALSVAAASCYMSASVDAREFEATKAGTFHESGTTSQQFKFGTTTVECKSWTVTVSPTMHLSTLLPIEVEYKSCPGKFTADYTLNVNGTIAVDDKIVVEGSSSCKYTIEPAGNSGLKSIVFSAPGPPLPVEFAIGGVTYTASSGCGSSGTNGTYAGKILVPEIKLV